VSSCSTSGTSRGFRTGITHSPLRQSSGSSTSSTPAQGYTVAELRHLTTAYDAGRLDAHERRAFLTTKIARIARQIASLEEMRRTFERELSLLRHAE